MNTPRFLLLGFALRVLAPATADATRFHLANDLLAADFDDSDLTRLSIPDSSAVLEPANDSAALTVDGGRLATSCLKLAGTQQEKDSLTCICICGRGGLACRVAFPRPG